MSPVIARMSQLRYAGVKQQGDQLVTAGGRVLTVVATASVVRDRDRACLRGGQQDQVRRHAVPPRHRSKSFNRRSEEEKNSYSALYSSVPFYSSRSATIGSIDAARLRRQPARQQSHTEQQRNDRDDHLRIAGLHLVEQFLQQPARRERAGDAERPRRQRLAASTGASPVPASCCRVAPSAARTPISRVRCDT